MANETECDDTSNTLEPYRITRLEGAYYIPEFITAEEEERLINKVWEYCEPPLFAPLDAHLGTSHLCIEDPTLRLNSYIRHELGLLQQR